MIIPTILLVFVTIIWTWSLFKPRQQDRLSQWQCSARIITWILALIGLVVSFLFCFYLDWKITASELKTPKNFPWLRLLKFCLTNLLIFRTNLGSNNNTKYLYGATFWLVILIPLSYVVRYFSWLIKKSKSKMTYSEIAKPQESKKSADYSSDFSNKRLLNHLVCPIRGTLKKPKYNSQGQYSEEYWTVDLVKRFLRRGYVPEVIVFEKSISLGRDGHNSLRVDLAIRQQEGFLAVAEVKNNSRELVSAIKYQLIPAMRMLNAKYAIYFDGTSQSRIYFQLPNEAENTNLIWWPFFTQDGYDNLGILSSNSSKE